MPGRRCWTVPSPSGSRGEGKALPGSLLCYLWLQRTLRSRLVFCVMSLTAQGAHRGLSDVEAATAAVSVALVGKLTAG
ncbi:hypothetical protein CH1034_140075 [Klebsiella pneumoniae]|nr:hypothetical protein CH1034_140075 [Klebsiella pneumoniae]